MQEKWVLSLLIARIGLFVFDVPQQILAALMDCNLSRRAGRK
jgi:hypothetical protein